MTQDTPRQRSTESYSSSPEDDLLQALEHNDAIRFSEILSSHYYIDINKEFTDAPCNGRTLLEYACEQQMIQIAEILLQQKDLDINKMCTRSKMRPIHVAADKGDATLLERIISNGADVNQKTDKGKTALHILAANNSVSSMKILFNHPCSKNVLFKDPLDENKRSPVFLAAFNKAEEAVLLLANNGANLRLRSNMDDMDTLEMLQNVLPDLYEKLKSTVNIDKELWWALKDNDLDKFQEILKKGPNVNVVHNDQTCLHYACQNGLYSFAELLVNNNADVNKRNNASWMAVHYAAAIGNFELLELLDKYGADLNVLNVDGRTPLHLIVSKDEKYATEESEYEKCLDFVLENDKVNVNLTDDAGSYSPLHFAVSNKEEETVLKLLKHGADFTKENAWGERPLDLISNQTMNTFFDGCITFRNEKTKDFTITYDYRCLMPDNDYVSTDEEKASYLKVEDHPRKVRTETKVLRHLSKLKHHWQLLKHPLIKSFLQIKFQKCAKFYVAMNYLYAVFVSLLTYYCLTRFSSARVDNLTKENGTTPGNSSSSLRAHTAVGVILFLINTFLASREIFQFLVAPVRYIFTLVNLLEWGTILTLYVLLTYDEISGEAQHSLAATCLFLAWIELVFLFGSVRCFYIPISIFLQVSKNFITLMALYSLFLLGFIFTFYLLFKPQENFETFTRTALKTVVMMTGEFDFGDIPFSKHFYVGSVMFLLFLVFVTIVLMNLLTGLAVEDARKIKNNAEILSQKKLLEKTIYIEDLLIDDQTEFLIDSDSPRWKNFCSRWICCCCFWIRHCSRRIRGCKFLKVLGLRTLVFYRCLPDMKLEVKPKKHKLFVKVNDGCNVLLTRDIIKDTIRLQKVGKCEESLNTRMEKLEKNPESICGIERKLERLCKFQNALQSLDKLERKLDRLNTLEKKLESLSKLEKKLESMDKLEKKLESIDKIEKSMESLELNTAIILSRQGKA